MSGDRSRSSILRQAYQQALTAREERQNTKPAEKGLGSVVMSSDEPSAAARTAHQWKSLPVDNEWTGIHRTGAEEADLDAFEAKNGVSLPRAFRELYGTSDGTASPDACFITFYGLDVIPHYTESDGTGAIWVGFADYATSRLLFLMRFDDEHHGAVFADAGSRTLSLPDRALRIAESFESFLYIYLDDPQRLTARAD